MQNQQSPSSPPDGSNIVSHSTGSHPSQFTPKQKKLVPLTAKEQRALQAEDNGALQVSVQSAGGSPSDEKTPQHADGMLAPVSDEAGTQVSSSSGSGKPPSLDGKSVASGTTFALDEKESLRPDDSASVKAGEDDELFSPPGSGVPGSRMGSEDGTRAFRDQLREISRMDPARQAEPRPPVARGSSQGVLYVPPQGPGVGSVPDASRHEPAQDQESSVECPPDPRLLEALESPKDRIMVLKLEQDFVDFVKDPKEASLTLPQLNGYHRMLAHRLADYYMLGHVAEDAMAVQIYKTATCRLAPPLTAIAPPSTAASTPPPAGPQMKILRRGDNVGPTIANGSNAHSKTGSENGESGNDDDKKPKYPLSREEREAKYEAARKRIMGSARPSETPDEPSEKDGSRPSSTAPKKTKKKQQRNDSDDDFEARSAYSAYYATPYTPAGSVPSQYGFAHVGQDPPFAQSNYGHQGGAANGQQYGMPSGASWQTQPSFQQQQQTHSWMPNAQQPYDLSTDFQRSMSMQSGALPSPQTTHHGWPSQQQPYGGTQQWQAQTPYSSAYPTHAPQAYSDTFRPSSSASQTQNQQNQQNQPYAYGQLPSQTFPGRPPSNLEHPLPGSYKGKHFNPQSQTFVPNYTAPTLNSVGVQPFMSQIPQSNITQYAAPGMPSPMQAQQPSAVPPQGPYQQQQHNPYQPQQPSYQQHLPVQQQQQAPLPSPQQWTGAPSNASSQRSISQPLTHPLPQPVFPRQPSPNMPLPPKPEATPPRSNERSVSGGSAYGPEHHPHQQNAHAPSAKESSTIAKWGTPSSLPAKPPPAVEPFDPARFAQNQRQASHGAGARVPSAGSPAGYGQASTGRPS